MKRNDDEVAKEALRRASNRREKRSRRLRWALLCVGGAFTCLVAVLANRLPGDGFGAEASLAAAGMADSAGSGNAAAGGYVLAAVIGFVLGVVITLASVYMSRRAAGSRES